MVVIASSPKKGGTIHCVELAGMIYSDREDVNVGSAASTPSQPCAGRKIFGRGGQTQKLMA
jgi:hypothetical protein